MEVVTAREFRSNQGKFLIAAREGQSVLLTSRYGNFKITPVTSEDLIIERDIREALNQVKEHMDGRIDLPKAKDIIF
ncbi:MAG: prevent-host-death family protein [Muribaculaceae bacterium]|nr:prevent-host-death family protein [Muribaculaceae bacterium]